MQTLDDDKDAAAWELGRGSHRRLDLQGCGDRLLMPSYYHTYLLPALPYLANSARIATLLHSCTTLYVEKLEFIYVRTEAFDRLLSEDVCKIHKT